MRYKDERGWHYEVKPGLHIAGWTIYSFNPKKEKWWPWPCACWYETQKEAEKFLRRFARERDWQKAV